MNIRGAATLAALAHEGQEYKLPVYRSKPFGEAVDYYGFHIMGVVNLVRGYLEESGMDPKNPKYTNILIAAFLHDVAEDTWVGLEDLINLGINMETYYILKALTKKRSGETYFEYIKRVKTNEHAKIIKVCDLNFNLNNAPNDSLAKRYQKALGILAS